MAIIVLLQALHLAEATSNTLQHLGTKPPNARQHLITPLPNLYQLMKAHIHYKQPWSLQISS